MRPTCSQDETVTSEVNETASYSVWKVMELDLLLQSDYASVRTIK